MTWVDNIILQSRDNNPKIRLNALKQMCPCKVKQDIEKLWTRIFEMVDDPDSNIRYQVLHTICDGSPTHLETEISDSLEKFNHDSDQKIRRRAHKVMANYLRKGKWNIL